MSSTDVATNTAADEAVLAAQDAEFGDESVQVPILKIGQSLTREVKDGNAEEGEFINTLFNEGVGTVVDMIISFYNKGRFAADRKSGKAFVAFGPTIPESWAGLAEAADFIGTPFAEFPEAEEVFKERVNCKEIDWGHGPLVSTTHNYTGLVVVEEDGEDNDYAPVRLSLKRIDVPAHRKINTLRTAMLRNKPMYDKVFRLSTRTREFGRNEAYVVDPASIKVVRDTNPYERALGAELAQAVLAGRVQSSNAEDAIQDKQAAPENNGGLAV